MSQAASGTLLGSHQCVTCSGFVHASKTSAGGAAKVRVIRISQSEGVVTVAPGLLFVCGISLSPLLRAARWFLLDLVEVIVEALELLLPEPAVRLQPVVDLLQRRRDEGARAALRIAPSRHQPRLLEHLEVLRDARLAERERLHQLGHVGSSLRQPGENRAPG